MTYSSVEKTPLDGVFILIPKLFEDTRGSFYESFNSHNFKCATGQSSAFVQDNHSISSYLTLRGLHYQTDQVQGKLIRVIVGSIYDVAVDLRKESHTFGKWFGLELSAENKKQVWIPPGFAHGFLVLSDRAEVIYKTTDYYHPQSEKSILWDDADIGIDWPLPDNQSPILSSKDQSGFTWINAPKL